jgi:hypothetical protein
VFDRTGSGPSEISRTPESDTNVELHPATLVVAYARLLHALQRVRDDLLSTVVDRFVRLLRRPS